VPESESSMGQRKRKKQVAPKGQCTGEIDRATIKQSWYKRREVVTGFCLGVFIFVLYLATMLPGVDAGDSAELQFMSPIWGVCHPPGYAIEVCFGKLFSLLPIGPSIAWRLNFMMVVSGTIGVLALYGIIRRVTGSLLAAVTGALTLGLSSMYWFYSLVAEAYVFYSMFIPVGMYCLVRFIQANRAFWLYLAVLSFGICIADRISEILIMPGFLILWFSVRKKVNLSIVRILIALIILILPFIFTVSYHLIRSRPEKKLDMLWSRDSTLRYQILGDNFKQASAQPLRKRIRGAVRLSIGLNYKKDAKFRSEIVKWDINKYSWMLSGLGAKGQRYPEGDKRNAEQGLGTSIGILGIILAVCGVFFQPKNWGWWVLGFWMFGANLLFILWHHRWDNLTFTIPSLIGLSLLVGLGASGGSWKPNKKLIYQLLCLIVPTFLLLTNYSQLNRNTDEEKQKQKYYQKLSTAPFAKNSAIISTYWPAMQYRYLIHIEGGREDMRILYESPQNWQKLIQYFLSNDQQVYLYRGSLQPTTEQQFKRITEPDVWSVGFVKLPPPEQ